MLRGLRAAWAGKGVDNSFSEDIAQEATVKVIDRMDQFEGRSQFTTWAMTIAIRLAVNEFRRKSFRDVSLDGLRGDHSLGIQFEAVSENPGDRLLRDQVMRQLQELIQGLTDKQRVAMQALLGGMPVDVIAEKTGSNRNAVYKLVHDARTRLREGFDRAGYDWQDIYAAISGSA